MRQVVFGIFHRSYLPHYTKLSVYYSRICRWTVPRRQEIFSTLISDRFIVRPEAELFVTKSIKASAAGVHSSLIITAHPSRFHRHPHNDSNCNLRALQYSFISSTDILRMYMEMSYTKPCLHNPWYS